MGTAGELVLVIECEVPAHGFHVKKHRWTAYSRSWILMAMVAQRQVFSSGSPFDAAVGPLLARGARRRVRLCIRDYGLRPAWPSGRQRSRAAGSGGAAK